MFHRRKKTQVRMGQEECGNKLFVKDIVAAEFNIGHFIGNLLDVFHGTAGKERHRSPGYRTIADILKFLRRQIRQQPNFNRLGNVQMTTKGAGNIELIDILKGIVQFLQEGLDAGKDRSLGTDKIIQVGLSNYYITSGS